MSMELGCEPVMNTHNKYVCCVCKYISGLASYQGNSVEIIRVENVLHLITLTNLLARSELLIQFSDEL